MDYHDFRRSFRFKPDMTGFIGIEREFFLVDGVSKKLRPDSPEFLRRVQDPRWTYELSACQVEDRTVPCSAFLLLEAELRRGLSIGRTAALSMGCNLESIEVAPEDMPRDLYPADPRYARIAETLRPEQILAALRVTGTHVHYGVQNLEVAIRLSNILNLHLDELIRLGDGSYGERLALYRTVATYPDAPQYEHAEHYFEVARQQGFAENPKNCWHLIRISPHGTVEVRVFGAAYHRAKQIHDIDQVITWAKRVSDLAELL